MSSAFLDTLTHTTQQVSHQLFTLDVYGLAWTLRHGVNQVALPIFWKEKPEISEEQYQSHSYAWLRNSSDISRLQLNSTLQRKGFCYGVSLHLVKLILESDDSNPTTLLKTIEADPTNSLQYQAWELLRNSDLPQKPPMPQPDKLRQFDNSDNLETDLQTALSENNDLLVIIRYWQDGNASSHAIMVRSSPTENQNWFHDNKWHGTHAYSSKAELVESLTEQLKIVENSPFHPKGNLAIEAYNTHPQRR